MWCQGKFFKLEIIGSYAELDCYSETPEADYNVYVLYRFLRNSGLTEEYEIADELDGSKFSDIGLQLISKENQIYSDVSWSFLIISLFDAKRFIIKHFLKKCHSVVTEWDLPHHLRKKSFEYMVRKVAKLL